MKKLLELIKKLLGLSSKESEDSKGFTLIELLIVIAVLGVLAAAILIAIDPVEQLARGRDGGRKNTVSETGRAFETYYTANSVYPAASGWDGTLVNFGDIRVAPTDPGGTLANCATAGTAASTDSKLCYRLNTGLTDFVVYSHMESKSEQRKGACAGTAANTWYVYSSYAGKAGVVCQTTEPAAGVALTFY